MEKKRIAQSGTLFETPNKQRIYFKPVKGIDDFDQCVMRRIIDNFYIEEKCLSTIPKIHTSSQTGHL